MKKTGVFAEIFTDFEIKFESRKKGDGLTH